MSHLRATWKANMETEKAKDNNKIGELERQKTYEIHYENFLKTFDEKNRREKQNSTHAGPLFGKALAFFMKPKLDEILDKPIYAEKKLATPLSLSGYKMPKVDQRESVEFHKLVKSPSQIDINENPKIISLHNKEAKTDDQK